jgi:prepilin-type N-terminal cleavage/methylation domain-containing protein
MQGVRTAVRTRNTQKKTRRVAEAGFSLPEFLIASVILLLVSAAVFGMLGETQRAASYQTEIQGVLDNTRISMETVERIIRQAGNDPRSVGFQGVTIVSTQEVQIQSDLTGSAAPGNPDRGDPDGDTADSNENVTIRYNAGNQAIELVPAGGSAQMISNYISGFSMQYFDAAGLPTLTGADVRRIAVTVTGASSLPDPQTHEPFSMKLGSNIQLATRQ